MLQTIRTAALWFGAALLLALALLLVGSLLPIHGGYQLRIVQTGSMRPTMPVGSAVVVMAAPQYHVGDILTFQRASDREATTHRLVKITTGPNGETLFIVRGDANNADDMQPVKPREVVGKVRLIMPYLGYLLAAARGPVGFVVLIGIPAALIIYEQGKRIVAEVKKVRSQSTTV